MTRRLFFLVVQLASTAALADTSLYPFKLSMRAQAGQQVVIAQNDGPAPILATVDLSKSENAIVDHVSPIVVVVKPQESIPIATVHGAVAGKGFRISTSYKFSIGVPDVIPDPMVAYRLPFQDGQKIMIGQVLGGTITTHNAPDSKYAIDFDIANGTPVLAARKGRVVDIDQGFTKGGNDPSLRANHVMILHEDGTLGMYSHLSANRINVTLGERVETGALLGYSGNTGYSTGPHLHFAVLSNTRTQDGTVKYVAVPVSFINGSSDHKIQFTQHQNLVVNSAKQ